MTTKAHKADIKQVVDLISDLKDTPLFDELKSELENRDIALGTLKDLYNAYASGFSDGVHSKNYSD